MTERVFDWRPRHDERSRAYSVADSVSATEPDVETVWETGPIIDQGSEGACVGFAWTDEFTAEPYPDIWVDAAIATRYARDHYHAAQVIDEWPGEEYSGTSVLAGAKVAVERGLIGEYQWALSTDYVKYAVTQLGPVVLGIPWYSEMYSTDEAGRVIAYHDMNNFVGGHAITLTGYYPTREFRYSDGRRETVGQVFRWTNSWGSGYGVGGHGFVTFGDLDRLLNTYGWPGEACIPRQRHEVDLERILDPTIPPRPQPQPEPEEPTMTRGNLIDHALQDLDLWLKHHDDPKKRKRARRNVKIAKRALSELPFLHK